MKNRVFHVLAALVLISFTFSSVYSEEKKQVTEPSYSKPFSVFLSVITPGLGQIYSGQVGKGLSIWGASSILVVGFLTTVADFDFRSVAGAFPFNMGMQFKTSLTSEETFWAVSLGVTYAFLYLYNVLDISLYDNSAVVISPTSDGFIAEYSMRF